MKMSTYQKSRKLKKYGRVRILYKQGLTIRDIAEIKSIGMSRQWVWFVVKGKGIRELERLNLPDLTLETKI